MNNSSIWIEKFYSGCSPLKKCCKTFLYFMLPMIILFIPFFITRGTYVLNFNIGRRLALLCAGGWGFIGPLCIQYYFEKIRLFDSFVNSIKDKNENHIDYLKKYLPLYKKLVIIISIFWGLAIVIILLYFRIRLEDYAFYGFRDFYYWLLICYCLLMAHFQAFGFAGLILVVLLLSDCLKSETLLKKILMSDFSGGVKKIGSLIVTTCICFGTGALYFPILISFARQGSNLLKWATYGLATAFAVALFLFFIISFFVIQSYAKKSKGLIISDVKSVYDKKLNESILQSENDNIKCIKNELQIYNLHDRIKDLESINVNPIDLQGITATVLTIFVPVILYIKDIISFLSNIL